MPDSTLQKDKTPMVNFYEVKRRVGIPTVSVKNFVKQYNPYLEDMERVENRLLKEFGIRVRQERRKRGLTQEKLGERAGISGKYIGEIERAEKVPGLLVIVRIAAALGINPASLICTLAENCEEKQNAMDHIGAINRILMDKDQATLKKVLHILHIIFDKEFISQSVKTSGK